MLGTLARVLGASVAALAPIALALAWLGERWHRGAAVPHGLQALTREAPGARGSI